jgi:hypothetical protein
MSTKIYLVPELKDKAPYYIITNEFKTDTKTPSQSTKATR